MRDLGQWITARRNLLLLASVVLGALAFGTCRASAQAAGEPITIGVLYPLTGPSSELGQGFQYGAELAIAEINAHGGINGRPIRLIMVDDKSKPDGSVTAVQRLTTGDKVMLLWSGSSSSPTVAVLPRLKAGPTPFYVGFASDPRVLHPFSKYVYSGAAAPVSAVVEALSSFVATTLKAKTVATMFCDQANCKAAAPLVHKRLGELGAKLVAEQTFHSGDTDFTGQVNAVKAANPDVVVVWGLPVDGGRLVGQLRRAGITAKIVGDTGVADQTVIDLGGPAAEGLYAMWIGGAQFLGDPTGPMADWQKRFAKAYPDAPAGFPNQYSMRAYADAYVIAEALRRAGKDLSPENIVRQLDSIHDFVAGKDGHFTYAAAIGLPRGFSPADHQGTKELTPVIVKGRPVRRGREVGRDSIWEPPDERHGRIRPHRACDPLRARSAAPVGRELHAAADGAARLARLADADGFSSSGS